MNNLKELLANTLADLGNHPSMSDCEKYGMTFGCDVDCPALNDGKCELFKDVEDFIKQKGE